MKKILEYFLILAIFILFSTCTKKDSNPTEPGDGGGSNNITLGSTVEVINNQTIGTGGGKITVSKPGDKLDGLEITIPTNAFTQTKTFKISYAEIKSHQLGQYFNPVTPMISISYEGGYSNQPMEVKVPMKLPKDHFAMGYFYDETTGKLEGLAIESLDSNYITVSTRTFSQSSSLGKMSGIRDLTSMGKMIISSISESDLKKQTVIASGFLPGVDDWEFINYGSYIAPGGHCAGQSMTMMWYYYEKKLKGEQSLFHRFDEVNDKTKPKLLWQDNPYGYRFASTIQKDFNWDGWITSLEWKQYFPQLTFNAFAASILLTGEPQFVLIRNSAGKGGHAMVVYKVNMNEQKLYIADPNYPNNRVPADGSESIRTIDLVNGALKPYETGLTAGAKSITMDQIGYFGKTTYIEWGQMAKRWTEFENKTIGNDRFPAYDLMFKNGSSVLLQDNMIYDKDTLKVYCKSTTSEEWLPNTDHFQPLEIFNDKGDSVVSGGNKNGGIASIPLKIGLNKIGFNIKCGKNGQGRYTDFKWFNIYYSTLKIEPDPLDGKPNVEQSWIAHTYGSAPKQYKMVWNFGDNTSELTVNNDSTAKHSYTKEGTFNVRVKLYDQANKLISETVATANIQEQMGEPEITSVSPDSAIAEQLITIKGKNFGNEQKDGYVNILYGTTTEIISWTNTQIIVKVPLYAKDYIFISVVRKTTGDTWEHSSDSYKYKIYPDIFVTLKRVNRFSYGFAGTFINQYGDKRDAQSQGGYFEPTKPIHVDGGSFILQRSDSLEKRPGEEIFWNYNISLTVSADGKSISGTIAWTGENRYVQPTIYKQQRIVISNMKLLDFDHEKVWFSCTDDEGRSIVSSFLDDGGFGWDKYVDYDEKIHGSVGFYWYY